ncbi:GerMN domain-containing protein [Aquipuribacter sp. MA13-6]|uniref:GerMN domain-containing protein n=1 Tax=unclassified Aquipuribacter TaxID=2635084 RepID=UPI003EEF4CAD
MTTTPAPGRRRRWPTVLAVAVLTAVLVVLVWLLVVNVLLGDDAGSDAGPTTTASPTTDVTTSAEPSEPPEPPATSPEPSPTTPTGPTGPVELLTVWFAGEHEDTLQNPALYPETVEVTVEQGQTTVQAALDALLSTLPHDPDYANAFWDEDSESSGRTPATATVTGDAGGTVVDLPAEAFGIGVGSEYAALGVQQVVSTVLSNGAPSPVTLTVDGQAGAEVWGVIALEPEYEPDESVRTSASIVSVRDGGTTRSPVTISGVGFGFEGELDVQVLDEATGDVVESTFVALSGGAELDADGNPVRSEYTVDVPLDPGTYRLVVADGNEGDEGPAWISYDDKVVTVE